MEKNIDMPEEAGGEREGGASGNRCLHISDLN